MAPGFVSQSGHMSSVVIVAVATLPASVPTVAISTAVVSAMEIIAVEAAVTEEEEK